MCWGTHSLWVTVLPWVSRQLLNSAGIHGASAGPLLPHPAACLWGQRLSHSRTGSSSGVPVKWNKSLDKHWDSPKWEHEMRLWTWRGNHSPGYPKTCQDAWLWTLLLTYPQGPSLHSVGYNCIVSLEGHHLFWKKPKQFSVLLLNHKAWCYLPARPWGTMARELSPPPVPSAHPLPPQPGCIPHAELASSSQPAGMHNDEN